MSNAQNTISYKEILELNLSRLTLLKEDYNSEDNAAASQFARYRNKVADFVSYLMSQNEYIESILPVFNSFSPDSDELATLTDILDEISACVLNDQGGGSIVSLVPVVFNSPLKSNLINASVSFKSLFPIFSTYFDNVEENLNILPYFYTFEQLYSKLSYQDIYARNFDKLNAEAASFLGESEFANLRFMVVIESQSALQSLNFYDSLDYSPESSNLFNQIDDIRDKSDDDYLAALAGLFRLDSIQVEVPLPYNLAILEGILRHESVKLSSVIANIMVRLKVLPAELTCYLTYHKRPSESASYQARFSFGDSEGNLVGGLAINLSDNFTDNNVMDLVTDVLGDSFNIYTEEVTPAFVDGYDESPSSDLEFLDKKTMTWITVDESAAWSDEVVSH